MNFKNTQFKFGTPSSARHIKILQASRSQENFSDLSGKAPHHVQGPQFSSAIFSNQCLKGIQKERIVQWNEEIAKLKNTIKRQTSELKKSALKKPPQNPTRMSRQFLSPTASLSRFRFPSNHFSAHTKIYTTPESTYPAQLVSSIERPLIQTGDVPLEPHDLQESDNTERKESDNEQVVVRELKPRSDEQLSQNLIKVFEERQLRVNELNEQLRKTDTVFNSAVQEAEQIEREEAELLNKKIMAHETEFREKLIDLEREYALRKEKMQLELAQTLEMERRKSRLRAKAKIDGLLAATEENAHPAHEVRSRAPNLKIQTSFSRRYERSPLSIGGGGLNTTPHKLVQLKNELKQKIVAKKKGVKSIDLQGFHRSAAYQEVREGLKKRETQV